MQAVASALPPAVRRKDKNPARRTFQALRIAVNGELDALSEGLDVLFAALKPGGRDIADGGQLYGIPHALNQ